MKDYKNLGLALSREMIKSISGGNVNVSLDLGDSGDLPGHKCCRNGVCGACVRSSGIPTCSRGYTLTSCTVQG